MSQSYMFRLGHCLTSLCDEFHALINLSAVLRPNFSLFNYPVFQKFFSIGMIVPDYISLLSDPHLQLLSDVIQTYDVSFFLFTEDIFLVIFQKHTPLIHGLNLIVIAIFCKLSLYLL